VENFFWGKCKKSDEKICRYENYAYFCNDFKCDM